MITVPVSEFRANLPKYLKNLEKGERIKITSRGKIVGFITPPDLEKKELLKN